MPTIDIITARRDLDALESAWDAIVESDSHGIGGLDATSGFAWTSALIDARLSEGDWWVLVDREGTKVNGILPLFRACRLDEGPANELRTVQEIYGGRTGFVVRPDSPGAAARMLTAATQEIGAFGSLRLTLCEGSRSYRLFFSDLAPMFVRHNAIAVAESPYISLQGSLDEYFGGLDREFRNVLGRRARRLHELGNVRASVHQDASSVAELMRAIERVEANSWKEAAGTSIGRNTHQARFYDLLAPRAALAGTLDSMVIWLDDRPIAYQLAIRSGDGVLGLKTSFDNALRSVSPGNYLCRAFVEHAHSLGCTVFDLMGATEPYKMKWTDRTYRRITYRCFPRTARGVLELARSASQSIAKRMLPGRPDGTDRHALTE